MNIKQIKPNNKSKPLTFTKVAAYARVSANRLKTQESLLAQLDYYADFIRSHVDWEPAGLYYDEGLSGTKADRPGFNAMMESARKGEIDLILTKSITRFARNTVTLLSAIRELKDLGIDVYFEEENLYAISETGELLLTLLAMKAEEEARNYSDLAKMSVRKRFSEGDYTHSGRLFGYQVVDGKYEILEEEAEIVRRIFNDYLAGKSISGIAKALNKEGLQRKRTPNRYDNDGKSVWRYSSVDTILRNEVYTGNVLLQKTYTTDFRTKKRVINTGVLDQYYVAEDHPAIISVETYELATKRRNTMERIQPLHYANQVAGPPLFQKILFCGECGSPYQRRIHVKNQCYRLTYNCSRSKYKYRDISCHAPRLRESLLIAKTKEALGIEDDTPLTRDLLLSRVERIVIQKDPMQDNYPKESYILRFYLINGDTVILPWDCSHQTGWQDDWKPLPEDMINYLNENKYNEDNNNILITANDHNDNNNNNNHKEENI